jgi:PAS domain S-box-containing protein
LLLQHSDNVATFFVSGHAYDQGCITDVNVACLKLLGYSRAELEGRDMSMLLPSPYDQTHSTLLQHFLNSNMDAENIHQNQQLYLRHKNGCIIPIDVLVRQIFTAAGSAFLVLCSPKQTSDYFVVLNPENVVTACTAEFAAVFSQNLPQIANGTVRISSVIKSFDVHESKMQHPKFVFVPLLMFHHSSISNVFFFFFWYSGIAIDQVVNESNAKFVLYLSTLSFANPSPTLQQWRMLRITPVLPTATLLRKKSSPFITSSYSCLSHSFKND